MKTYMGKFSITLALAALLASPVLAQVNPFGGQSTPAASGNRNRPVSRGYIIPTADPIAGGAKVTVEIFHNSKNDPVSLFLQAAVNDGKGGTKVILLETLSDNVSDNPSNYYSKREFDVSFAKINRELAKMAPGAGLKIGPGTPLFVYARFNNGHQWGGVARGGVVFTPGTPAAQDSASKIARPTELDLAYNITQTLANVFNSSKDGLKVGGQIRSRVEAEGKYQISVDDFDKVREALFKVGGDPAEAARVLGSEWTMKLEDRYLMKSGRGLKKDKKGFPIPDPMVDTYYDNDGLDAAKTDIAIRYRWTEGNRTGAWNVKPGMAAANADGVVYRTEYGVDSTDDKPGTIAAFADSSHPLNPFRFIEMVTGGRPSTFLKPSVEVTDYRYKFKLEHKSGLVIELSLDDVRVKSLRGKGRKTPMRYIQMELDIDHLATQSSNVAAGSGALMHSTPAQAKAWLAKLGPQAFLDGRPVLHDASDLKPGSAIRKAREAEFKLATQAIRALREELLGKDWIPGAQKYAMAAHALDMVSDKEASPSVQEVLTENAKLARSNRGGALTSNKCEALFTSRR